MLRQKTTAGVSLAVVFLLALRRNYLFLKCFAVLHPKIFSYSELRGCSNTGVLQEHAGSCGEKDGGKTESIPMTNRLIGGAVL